MGLFLQDSNLVWYEVGVDTTGKLTTTTPVPTPSLPVLPTPTCTITLADTIAWTKKMNFGRNSAIGSSLEPALTSANIIKQTILSPPFEWRWNRQEYSWTCVDRDEVWTANTVYALGHRLIDSNGNLQTVTSIGLTPFESGSTEPTWNTDTDFPGGITVDGNLIWTASDIQTYTQAVSNFGWIEHANVQDISQTPPQWIEMQPKLSLALDSSLARPRYISAHNDDNDGNIGFVLTPVPNLEYPINIHVQKKAQLFSDTADTWAPIPDEYSYIYNWGFLALMYLFADDPRFAMANQKFIASILSNNEGLTETERNMFLANWGAITGTQMMKESQGTQARGI
jgi:hypothetical protein